MNRCGYCGEVLRCRNASVWQECGTVQAPTVETTTPLADEAEQIAARIRRNGDTLEAIQKAINERGGPDEYGATLLSIRNIIHKWEDHDA